MIDLTASILAMGKSHHETDKFRHLSDIFRERFAGRPLFVSSSGVD